MFTAQEIEKKVMEARRAIKEGTYKGAVLALRDNGKWTPTKNWKKCNKLAYSVEGIDRNFYCYPCDIEKA